jgi:hypothetical protein
MRSGGVRQQWTYNAPPTISAFLQSEAFGRLIWGPVGSGKTTGCIVEAARRMAQQAPAADGRRYTRFAIVRQSLKDAKATVLKDVRGWFGSIADWRVSESTLYLEYGDVVSEWPFIPLDEPDDVKRLLSLQLTAAYVNECIETDINLLSDIAGRVGRYPNNDQGVCSWSGIWADTNAPILNTPWANFLAAPPPQWQVFHQPGGHIEPTFASSGSVDAQGNPIMVQTGGAENLPHLNQTAETILLPENDPIRIKQGRGYYERLLSVGSADYIRRYVWSEFGRDPSGAAVFAESFKYDYHVSQTPLDPVYSRMLIVGQDFGRSPWSLICQLDHAGRLLVLEEVAGRGPTGENIGLEQHAKQNLIPVLIQPRYVGRAIGVVGDPSGQAKDSLFELNSFDLLKRCGLAAEPAPTNDLEPRLRGVESFFTRNVGGGPAILIDGTRCPTLVAALNGQYKFEIDIDKSGGEYRKTVPEKLHPWSDVADALQYVCLVAGNAGAYAWVMGRIIQTLRPRRAMRTPPSALAWT